MQTLYQKASHSRSHTWKDIGGLGGLLLDGAFFIFLLIMSAIVLTAGVIALVCDYLIRPVLALLSRFKGFKKRNSDETILLEDGPLESHPSVLGDHDDVKATETKLVN
jgi:hypothetical protein